MNNLKYLGSGIPLFSDYALFSFVVLIVSFLVYGLYLSIYFHNGTHCDYEGGDYCGTGWQSRYTAGNVNFVEVRWIEAFLMVVLLAIIIALRIGFFAWARKKDSVIDFENCTPSDFTVMVTGLPKTTTPNQVKKAFEDYFFASKKNGPQIGNNIKAVEKVNFSYFIGSYIKLA